VIKIAARFSDPPGRRDEGFEAAPESTRLNRVPGEGRYLSVVFGERGNDAVSFLVGNAPEDDRGFLESGGHTAVLS